MKIISLGPAYPYRGGIASFNDRLARQLAKEGHDIETVTFTLQYPSFLFPGKTQYTDAPAPEGLKIIQQVNSINPFNWISTGISIRKKNPDILLLRFWLPFLAPSTGTIARIAGMNRKTAVICIFDNVVPHERRIGDNALTKYMAGSIDGAIVMSGSVRDDLEKIRSDIPVVYNPHPLFDNYGPPVEKADAIKILELDDNYSYLLFFGFIRAYKGLDLLIKALADTRLSNLPLKLLVTGEFYEDEAPYRELVKDLALTDRVIFYNRFIRDEEVPLLFGAADLVVQPYKSATQSGVTQIAYHYEKPMLVTDTGGLGEIVPDGKCGYVVKPDPSEIAASIADFYNNNRKQALTEGVKSEKKRFSWESMTSTIMTLYEKVKQT